MKTTPILVKYFCEAILVAVELSLGFEATDCIVSVALVEGRDTPELLMIVNIVFPVGNNNIF